MIRVTDLLGAVIFFLLIALFFLSFKARQRKKTQQKAIDEQVRFALYNAADRAGQTENTRINAESNVVQTNPILNTAVENARSEGNRVYSQPGDVRFALDKVSSADGTIRGTLGGLEIGAQDSDL